MATITSSYVRDVVNCRLRHNGGRQLMMNPRSGYIRLETGSKRRGGLRHMRSGARRRWARAADAQLGWPGRVSHSEVPEKDEMADFEIYTFTANSGHLAPSKASRGHATSRGMAPSCGTRRRGGIAFASLPGRHGHTRGAASKPRVEEPSDVVVQRATVRAPWSPPTRAGAAVAARLAPPIRPWRLGHTSVHTRPRAEEGGRGGTSLGSPPPPLHIA